MGKLLQVYDAVILSRCSPFYSGYRHPRLCPHFCLRAMGDSLPPFLSSSPSPNSTEQSGFKHSTSLSIYHPCGRISPPSCSIVWYRYAESPIMPWLTSVVAFHIIWFFYYIFFIVQWFHIIIIVIVIIVIALKFTTDENLFFCTLRVYYFNEK